MGWFPPTLLPVLVARDGHVVDVLGEVEGRSCWVGLVIEGPVPFRTVVDERRVLGPML
jgi:hypothetical protein